MPVIDNTVEPAAVITEDNRPVVVQRICLDFQFRAERHQDRFARFLETHRGPLGLGDPHDPASEYLQRVWPDGLPGSVIITNTSADEYGRWLLRPPVVGPHSSTFAVGGHAPAFRAYRRQGRLVVDGFVLVPHVQPRSFEVQVSGQVHINPSGEWMEPDDFALLEALPRQREHAEERLQLWRSYLNWREKLVHLGQVALRYERREITDGGKIRFSTRGKHDPGNLKRQVGSAVMLVAPLGASRSQDRWDPPTDKRQRLVRVGSVVKIAASNGSPASRLQQQGEHRRLECANADGQTSVFVTVQPDDDDRDAMLRAVPEEGFLLTSVFGDLKPLHTERRGMDRFRKDQGHNAYLPAWLFDVRQAGVPEATPSRSLDEEVLAQLDDDQRAAVTKAMAAPARSSAKRFGPVLKSPTRRAAAPLAHPLLEAAFGCSRAMMK